MQDATAGWEAPKTGRLAGDRALALVLLGSPHEPGRVGEVALLPAGDERILGRQGTLDWVQQRPGDLRRRGSLTEPTLSRQHLRIRASAEDLSVQNLGRLPLWHNGQPVSDAVLRPGDLFQIADRVLLGVVDRPLALPGAVEARHRFGEADGQGLIGESEAAWSLRERVVFLARRDQHVLVLGPSGTGKELVAQALHALSPRARAALISRNAATIPESLADAELFGNLAGYPNPGTPGRSGLVGEADGSSLFLDEFGELPVEQQARLLRVMDSGEYTRLGEARPRRSDLRVIAATNRDPAALKHDVLARFALRIEVPPLTHRREDVPLLAAHLLRGIAASDPELRGRFFDGVNPRLDLALVAALVSHPYTTHVRELTALLWQAIASSRGDRLELPPSGWTVSESPTPAASIAGPPDPWTIDPKVIQDALDRHGGRQDPVWRELGLASRHVLGRLVKKHGLTVRGRG